MGHASRPGDRLAGRYQLLDLLAESGDGRFWRAHDLVLERYVAVHVIRADDARAPLLTEAARRSATVHDPHVLRVLDVDVSGEVCYVVNEWGTGASLDIVVANRGPLGPRRAAWLVAETATAVAAAHAVGVSHGRLVPENVLIDRSGGVRIIGMCVDAALHGLGPERSAVDVTDLAGLLYCALTTSWPGASASAVAAAPRDHGEVLRPRRVRAGVPRALDTLCEEVLVRRAASSARRIADDLLEFVGDPTGLPEALLESAPDVAEEEFVVLPPLPELTVRDAQRLDHPPVPPTPAAAPTPAPAPAPAATRVSDPGSEADTDAHAADAAAPGPGPRVRAASAADLPTEAGLPIFGDDDDVSWLQKRTEPAPPPPPFEAPPERPLFAPDPPDGRPLRQPRPGTEPAPTDSFWPWADDDPDHPVPPERSGGARRNRAPGEENGPAAGPGATSETATTTVRRRRLSQSSTTIPAVDGEVPGRSFLRLAAGLVVVLLLGLAVIVAVNIGRGKNALGGDPSPPDRTPRTSTAPVDTPTATALRGLRASYFDPEGSGGENGQDARLAVDGDPRTAWPTQTYRQQLGPGGLKDGVGLVVDLGQTRTLTAADLTFVGMPTAVDLYVLDRRPTTVAGLARAAGGTASGTHLSLPLDAHGRYVVVWLTRLPPVSGGGYRGAVAQVTVEGE